MKFMSRNVEGAKSPAVHFVFSHDLSQDHVRLILINHPKKNKCFFALMLVFISLPAQCKSIAQGKSTPDGLALPPVKRSWRGLCALLAGEKTHACINLSVYFGLPGETPHLSVSLSTGCPNQSHFQEEIFGRSSAARRKMRVCRVWRPGEDTLSLHTASASA